MLTDSMDRPLSRVVLLGASNLTRAISTVVGIACQRVDSPIEVLAALGHGRSYGIRSKVLVREIGGIVDCGLWSSLEQRAADADVPTYGLITDVGNDIIYGVDVETIAGWVEQCLDRLLEHDTRLVITRLPTQAVRRVPPWRFEAIRRLLFPNRRLTRQRAVAAAQELDERLIALCRARGIEPFPVEPDWFGFDAIHIRAAVWSEAWPRILRGWRDDPNESNSLDVNSSIRRWLALRSSMPARYRLCGSEMSRTQPASRLADGTTVSFY
jgi:hypothetical protein